MKNKNSNSNINEEKVICISRGLVSKYKEKVFWDPFLFQQIMDVWKVDRWKLNILPRSKAERDYYHKQLVAYVIIKSGDLYLTYERTVKSGETRLWKKFSIGVGGHLTIDDMRSTSQLTLAGSLKAQARGHRVITLFSKAALREIEEEIVLNSDDLDRIWKELSGSKPRCFINDDESDDVGKLHLGIVWVLNLPQPNTIAGKKGLAHLKFCDIKTLKENKSYFEHWSQLLIDHIASGRMFQES